MKAFPLPQEVASYHPGLRTIHWLMAALIFVTLPLGVWASLLPGGSGARIKILFFHKSIGVTILGLIALRIVWRLIVGAPAYPEPLGKLTQAAFSRRTSRAIRPDDRDAGQRFLASTAGGRAVSWFGLFELPRLVAKDKVLAVAAAGRTWCSPGCSPWCWPRISAPSSGTQ